MIYQESPATNDETLIACQTAISASPVSMATLIPVNSNSNRIEGFRVIYANSSFSNLVGDGEEYRAEAATPHKPVLLNRPDVRVHLLQAVRENKSQFASIQFKRREQSLVLQLHVTPVGEQLVITLVDVTSLSHAREMLELQTTLMEENARSLEAVRRALEAEIKRRGQLENKLRRLAGTDYLSGLANRRSFLEKATAEFRRSQRYQHPLSLVMLDLDYFKSVNDTHGHAAGDCVIVAISQICQSLSRDGVDIVGRLGGEEFAILLPETSLKGANNFAERLRLMIENTPIYCDIKKLSVTASFGVANLQDQDRDFSKLLNRSDAALYASKDAGRNMVSSQ